MSRDGMLWIAVSPWYSLGASEDPHARKRDEGHTGYCTNSVLWRGACGVGKKTQKYGNSGAPHGQKWHTVVNEGGPPETHDERCAVALSYALQQYGLHSVSQAAPKQ